LKGAPTWVEAVAFDVLVGVDNIKVDGIEPRPGEVTGGPFLDLALRSSVPIVLRCTTPSDVIPVLGSSGAVDPRVAGPGSSGSPDSLSPPVDWGRVESSVAQVCHRR
jgi:hypothetical protein